MSDAETTTTEATTSRDATTTADDKPDDRAELKDALAKERTRAKDAERDLKKLQARLDELDGKDKSDVERLTKERDALQTTLTEREAALRQRTGRVMVMDAAGKANAIEPLAVYGMVRDDIEFDDDGEPTNIDALIAQTRKATPLLFRATAGSGDGGKGGDGTKPDLGMGFDRLRYAHEQKSKQSAAR